MKTNDKDIFKYGFLGLGAMGSGMTDNLLAAGSALIVYDIDKKKTAEYALKGVIVAESIKELVKKSDIILTSLPSSDIFVEVAEKHLIPDARAGQVFIDLGTVTVSETRRISALFKEKGAYFLDAPVSGGEKGAHEGNLHIFIGGEKSIYDKCWPIFQVIGNIDHIVYCGENGAGQIVKGVNQMAMGLGAAAYLESIAYGVLAGVSPEIICSAIGGNEDWRKYFTAVANKVVIGKAETIGVKHGQLPYFIEESIESGFELPLSNALYNFCKNSKATIKEANRMSPSFWSELIKRKSS